MPHTCCCSERTDSVGLWSPNASIQYAPNKVIEPIHLGKNTKAST